MATDETLSLITSAIANEQKKDHGRTFEEVGSLCVRCSDQCDSGGDGVPTHRSRVLDTSVFGIRTNTNYQFFGQLCLANNAPKSDGGKPRVCLTGLLIEPESVFTNY